jgi:hypothetical protein
MKKEIAIFSLSILLLPLINAAFTVSEVFSYIDAQSIFIMVAFGVLGLMLSVILNRFPAFRGTPAGIISLLLSLGMTYGINKWVAVNDLLPSIGISGDILAYLPMALLVIFVISLFVFKWKAFLISGLVLIMITLFTDLVYEKTIVLTIGIVFMIIGLIWGIRNRTKKPLPLPTTPQGQAVYQQKQRNLYDLKQKYMAYLFAYNKRGLAKHERKRIIQAMDIIIDYARRVGVSKSDFLSNKIGGSNAKAPGDLRPPFDG